MPTDKDPKYDAALEIVRGLEPGEHPRVALLQRKLRLGYNQSARIIEQLEAAGVVSVPDVAGVRLYIEDRRSRHGGISPAVQPTAATDNGPLTTDYSALPILPMTAEHVLRVLLGWKTSTLRPSKVPGGTYRLAVDGETICTVQLSQARPVCWSSLDGNGRAELADCEGGYSVAQFVRLLASWPSKRGHTPYSDFANGKRELHRHHLRVLEVLHPVLLASSKTTTETQRNTERKETVSSATGGDSFVAQRQTDECSHETATNTEEAR